LLFASWIDRKNSIYNTIDEVTYEFKLLYSSSKNGLKATTFHQKCDNIYKTLVVARLQNSKQFVGGYNPLSWDGKGYKSTNGSFVFNIKNKYDIESARFSYVINSGSNTKHAIWCRRDYLPYFGNDGDVSFQEDGSVSCRPKTYNDIDMTKKNKFDELEVFQVVKKSTQNKYQHELPSGFGMKEYRW